LAHGYGAAVLYADSGSVSIERASKPGVLLASVSTAVFVRPDVVRSTLHKLAVAAAFSSVNSWRSAHQLLPSIRCPHSIVAQDATAFHSGVLSGRSGWRFHLPYLSRSCPDDLQMMKCRRDREIPTFKLVSSLWIRRAIPTGSADYAKVHGPRRALVFLTAADDASEAGSDAFKLGRSERIMEHSTRFVW